MKLNDYILKGVKYVKKESPIILAAVGAVTLVAAVVSAAKAPSPEQIKEKLPEDAEPVEVAGAYTKAYWKTATLTTVAVAGTIGSAYLGRKQYAGLMGSYMYITDKYAKYRRKVIEEVANGEELDAQIKHEIALEEYADSCEKRNGEHPVCSGEEEVFWFEGYPYHEFTDTREHVIDAIRKFEHYYYTNDFADLNKLIEYIDNEDLPQIKEDVGWSRWQGEMIYGYLYPEIKLETVEIDESDGKTFLVTIIRMPFEPHADYMEDV